MPIHGMTDAPIWKRRTTGTQWLIWGGWLIGIAIVAFAWKLVSGDIVRRLDGQYVFAAVPDRDDQTEVSYSLSVELAIPLPGFVKRRAEGRIMHAALDDLQARLET